MTILRRLHESCETRSLSTFPWMKSLVKVCASLLNQGVTMFRARSSSRPTSSLDEPLERALMTNHPWSKTLTLTMAMMETMSSRLSCVGTCLHILFRTAPDHLTRCT